MSYDDEFPLLRQYGLYAAQIRGDGNCLFNALSDQLYGAQDQHTAIRSRVIDYMRQHAEYYKMFLEVYPGGGTRRNPKRKNAGAAVSNASAGPTSADIDRVFEEHVTRMAQGGTWGDNMEIQAFASAFNINVKIYQREFAYVVSGDSGESRPFTHIAYHNWEHYSSIRNLDGPHSGLPDVTPKAIDPTVQKQLEDEARNMTYNPPDWQLQALSQSYPTADPPALKRALEETKGDIDSAWERLAAADEQQTVSSQQSSSVEREPDSDDEPIRGPNKRQDRRMSRTSKAQQQARHKAIAAGFEKRKNSLDDLVKFSAPRFSPPQIKEETSGSSSDSEGDADWTWTPPPLNDGDTSSGSEYTPPPEVEPPKIKIKLSMPKKEPETSNANPAPNAAKPAGVQKKPLSARDKRDVKKQAQKQAKKERVQAVASTKKTQPDTGSSFERTNHPTQATTAMRTLWI